jgi:hypothetical protein
VSAAAIPRGPLGASPAAVGACCCAVLAAWAIYAPGDVLRGWLTAFTILVGAPLGALALLCIGRLTGGRWAKAASPLLLRAAAAMPPLCLALLPILLGARLIFPWAVDGNAAGKDVARLYLNIGFFDVRGAAALIVMSVVAVMLTLQRGGRLLAGIGLVLYAIAVDFTSVDWMLSLAPRFSSSGFGAEIAIQNILLAFAMLLLTLPASRQDVVSRDLAGLTLAATMGVLYMETMALIVNWYGDQPDRAAWYLDRIAGPWLMIALGALAFGSVVPIIALLFAEVRRSPGALRAVGGCLLFGIVLHDVWLIGPGAAPPAIPAALLALGAIGGLAIGSSSWLEAQRTQGETRDGR